MGSRKKLLKRLREHEIVLPVFKGTKPMTKEEIDDYFKREREFRKKAPR